MQNTPVPEQPTPPQAGFTSSIALGTPDADKLIQEFAAPQVHSCQSKIVNDRLWLDLSVDTGIPLLGRLPVTLSLRATLDSPTTIAIDIQMEHALGVAGIVRHFLKSIIEHVLPPALRPIVQVESNTRLLVHLDKIQFAGHSLLGHLAVTTLQSPASAHALALTFTLDNAALPHLVSTLRSESPLLSSL